MEHDDSAFYGAIPALYERRLVPLLFEPWAVELAARIAALDPADILETAAGTGVLTRSLAARCPDASIIATDLNPAMLEVARSHLSGPNISFQAADALDLPFDHESFDVSTSQFGIMFYPDRVRGFTEAFRTLRPSGTLIAAVWGSLNDNEASKAIAEAVAATLPDNPPDFLARTPFGYHDPDAILADVEAGGFTSVEVEHVTLPHPPVPARSAAEGMCLGSPLRAEIEAHGPDALPRAVEAAERSLEPLSDGHGRINATMTALIITAKR